jgi:hypothetical protein
VASKIVGRRKRLGVGLEMKTFKGMDGQNYLVFRTPRGSYHTFLEVEAKQAAGNCGVADGSPRKNTRKMWETFWLQ